MFHKNDLFHTAINFDMRVPDFGAPPLVVYEETLRMIEFADRSGIDQVSFQEHHQAEDGYLPCPFLMGTAAAARTQKIAISMSAVVLPYHDPVKVAEQIAVADLISGGRFYTVLAGGYSPTEFAAFGVTLKDRPRLMEEGFEIIMRALSGERFTHNGREIYVRPLPSRDPREIVIAGGGSSPAARRAARHQLSMWPMLDSIIPDYEEECRRLGHEPGRLMRAATPVLVTDDPERSWAEIGPSVLHYARTYAAWANADDKAKIPMFGVDTLDKVREAGLINVVTPEEAITIGRMQAIGVVPLMGGLTPDVGWASLQMFVDKVLPHIKDAPQAVARQFG